MLVFTAPAPPTIDAMKIREYVRRSEMPVSPAELFEWHARPGALQRLLPPWQGVRVISSTGGIEKGARVTVSVPVGPGRVRLVAEHTNYREGEMFRDVQASGPFALWEHTHRFEPAGDRSSMLEDSIRYALPAGRAGDLVGGSMFRRDLDRMFDFRHERTRLDLLAHGRYRDRGSKEILLSGAGGLVGSEFSAFLTTGGHGVTPMTRKTGDGRGVAWSPEEGRIEAEKLSRFDAIVHLAGESIVGRWTGQKKRKIRDSRVKGTRLIAEALAKMPERSAAGLRRPGTLVVASATGFYGDRGDEVLSEESTSGGGFLAGVCREWEEACEPARQAGIRVVNVRIGLVLIPRGGLLGTLLPLFRAGLGGRVGDGRQWMGWIAIDDLVDVLHAAVMDETLSGPVNATAPNPVTNGDFTRTLGRVLRRPTVAAVPRFALRAALGESADELALASTRALPRRLQERSHPFRYAELEPALRFSLGR